MILSRMSSTRPTSAVVLLTVFVDIVGFGMILPILPGHAASLGLGPLTIGIVVGAYSAIQLLLAPLWGRVSDRYGRRPVLLLGLFGSAMSYVLFALAGNWWLLLISRLLDGGSGATINVAQAYFADATAPEDRARAMGKIGAAVGLGFIVGPMIGGIGSALGGTLTVAWIAAAITALNLIVAWRILPESVRTPSHETAPPIVAPPSRLLLPLTVLFLSTLAFSVIYVVFPLWGETTLGVSRSTVSYWFGLMGLVTAIVQGGVLVPRGWFGIAADGRPRRRRPLLPGASVARHRLRTGRPRDAGAGVARHRCHPPGPHAWRGAERGVAGPDHRAGAHGCSDGGWWCGNGVPGECRHRVRRPAGRTGAGCAATQSGTVNNRFQRTSVRNAIRWKLSAS